MTQVATCAARRHGMTTVPPNTIIVEVNPLRDPDDLEQHGPTFYWARGFLVGAILSAATAADMLGSGWNALRL
jgi:hypothetical protein